MRDLLERICRGQMQNESLQMTDLSARISFVSAKVGLSVTEHSYNRAEYSPPDAFLFPKAYPSNYDCKHKP